MSLTFYYHPLSSYCWKVLIALYESGVAFTPRQLSDLRDPAERAAYQEVWPLAKIPVLVDEAAGRTIPESTIQIDYLAATVPAAASLIPADPDVQRPVRLLDRLFDNYIHHPFQEIVSERMRPDDAKDPFGVEQNRQAIRRAFDAVAPMLGKPWAVGEAFTLADCAALPALYYADYTVKVAEWPALAAYLERLKARPSVARALKEAEPWFDYFPLRNG